MKFSQIISLLAAATTLGSAHPERLTPKSAKRELVSRGTNKCARQIEARKEGTLGINHSLVVNCRIDPDNVQQNELLASVVVRLPMEGSLNDVQTVDLANVMNSNTTLFRTTLVSWLLMPSGVRMLSTARFIGRSTILVSVFCC
jgi:hypothetical protein